MCYYYLLKIIDGVLKNHSLENPFLTCHPLRIYHKYLYAIWRSWRYFHCITAFSCVGFRPPITHGNLRSLKIQKKIINKLPKKDFGRTSFIIKLGNFKYVKIPFFTSEDVQQQQKSNWYNDQGKIWDLHDKLCRPSIGHPLSKWERY